MKRYVLLFALFFPCLYAQAADMKLIAGAFKSGDVSSLVWEEEVDITLPDASRKCDARSAVSLLNTFFKTNKPAEFDILHNADKKDAGFLVGKLTTSQSTFRVNVTYRIEGNQTIIQSIRIK